MGEATDKLGRFLDFRDQAVKADELRDNRRAIRERQRQGGEVAETESQPRQISRRQFLKGAGLTAAAIVGGAGVYKLVRTTMDTFQSIQSEPSIAGSETKANALAQETTKENITPYRFLPGKTTIDLTKVHLRTSPQVLDEMQGRNNNIDLSKIKSIEGITLIGNEKTMYVENAMLEEAYDANGDFMVFNAILKDEKPQKIYINYGTTKKTGEVVAEDDRTYKSGFIESDGTGGYFGEIPTGKGESIKVDFKDLNMVTFSEALLIDTR